MQSWLKSIKYLALTLALLPSANADQIDKEALEKALTPPTAVLVKVNPATKTVEVFRADAVNKSVLDQKASPEELAAAIDSVASTSNRVAEFKLSEKELDKESSTEAWRSCWYGNGWNWNGWGGYSAPYYYNWQNPYHYQPGRFSYHGNGYNHYNYGYNHHYRNCYYGWYY